MKPPSLMSAHNASVVVAFELERLGSALPGELCAPCKLTRREVDRGLSVLVSAGSATVDALNRYSWVSHGPNVDT